MSFALDAGLKVIVCIGERLEEREGGLTEAVVSRQLEAVSSELIFKMLHDCVLTHSHVIGSASVCLFLCVVYNIIHSQL